MSLNRLVYCNMHFLTKDSAMYLKFDAINLINMEVETLKEGKAKVNEDLFL